MAKASNKRQSNKLDIENISERDRDFLTLDVKDSMKKYKIEKQAVYDRRHSLNKKIKEAGLTIEDLLFKGEKKAPEPAKKAAPKKVKQANAKKSKPTEPKPEETIQEPIRDIVKYEKPVPVIMKPIEINFENFTVKLNGVPKKISVNPETNAIEIDL